MNGVNKTLYIPLYGKSYVSRKGLFLRDKKAEEIWDAGGFPLKGKSASKWLAYYMGIRSAVFDEWVRQQITAMPDAVIIHIGCGLDSRALRVDAAGRKWYDVDFPEVIQERKKYFTQTADYRMIAADARSRDWLSQIPETGRAIVVMEGISMYLTTQELHALTANLCAHFGEAVFLMDCYTSLAARMSKYKNPINDVGVTTVYGMDDPTVLHSDTVTFVQEHSMTPQKYINKLHGAEKFIFQKLYAGNLPKKLYRLFEYRKNDNFDENS